jgi:hypothetical protein
VLLFGADSVVFYFPIQKYKKLCRTIVLPVVLYGCETGSNILKEERRLRVFENRLLKRLFGPNSDEVKGNWGRLSNKELNDLYSDDQMRELIGVCSTYGGEDRCIKNVDGET